MDPIERLYHYTSPQGLIGIISNRSLWATDALFLNDSREIAWGVELAQRQLRDFCARLERLRWEGEASHDEREQLGRTEWLIQDIRHTGTTNSKSVFVCSLSENGNLLSQWRAYCRGGGYSIGFPKEQLQHCIEKQTFSLEKCQYAESEQTRLVENALAQFAFPWIQGAALPAKEDEFRFVVSATLKWELLRLCSRLKHASFYEEAEWRIVSRPEHSPTADKLLFRDSGSLVAPYTVLELPEHKDGEFWREVRIIVGPTPHPEIAKAGARDLLKKFSDYAPVVTVTDTPFREW